jgi:hypothetical protein
VTIAHLIATSAADYSIPGLLGTAVIALAGLLNRQIERSQDRADKAIEDAKLLASSLVAQADARTTEERKRTDRFVNQVATVVERLDENDAAYYALLDGHLRYMRELLKPFLNGKEGVTVPGHARKRRGSRHGAATAQTRTTRMMEVAVTLSVLVVFLLGMLCWNMIRQRRRTTRTERIATDLALTPLEPDHRGEELMGRLEKVAEHATVRKRSIEEQMRALRTGTRR